MLQAQVNVSLPSPERARSFSKSSGSSEWKVIPVSQEPGAGGCPLLLGLLIRQCWKNIHTVQPFSWFTDAAWRVARWTRFTFNPIDAWELCGRSWTCRVTPHTGPRRGGTGQLQVPASTHIGNEHPLHSMPHCLHFCAFCG